MEWKDGTLEVISWSNYAAFMFYFSLTLSSQFLRCKCRPFVWCYLFACGVLVYPYCTNHKLCKPGTFRENKPFVNKYFELVKNCDEIFPVACFCCYIIVLGYKWKLLFLTLAMCCLRLYKSYWNCFKAKFRDHNW